MSPQELAQRWGVSERIIRRQCARGELPALRIVGRAWRLDVDALEARLEAADPHRNSK